MSKRFRNVKVISIIVVILTILTAAYAVYAEMKDAFIEKEAAAVTRKTYNDNQHDKDVIESFSDYEASLKKFVDKKTEAKLSNEERHELYEKGFDFIDIDIAESIARMCDKTPVEILECKGPTKYVEKIVEENGARRTTVVDSSKKWEDVINELEIDMRKPDERLGTPEEKINEMKEKGMSREEISEVAIIAFNYKKDYDEILGEVDKGMNLRDIKKKYWEEARENRKASKKVEKDNDKEQRTESTIKKQFNITEEDIEISKRAGIIEVFEIGYAKDLAKKYNTTLEKIMEIKSQQKDWSNVEKKLR